MQRIAVIGGGIAGLTIALRRAVAGDQVVLFEASAKLGGQLSSEARSGFLIEHGAEGFVARSEAVPALAEEVGIADRLVDQLEHRSFRFDGSALIELAPGEAGRLLGFQVPSDDLGRGIRSFVGGMGELPERIALALLGRIEMRLNSPVNSVTPRANSVTLFGANESAEDFAAVAIATTAPDVATLLGHAFGPTARALQDSTRLSSLTVSLGFHSDSVQHPLDGTGFIVPAPEQLAGLRAVSFSSSKLPHRASPGHALLRLFFRPSDHDLATLSDEAWIERAERALAGVLPLAGTADLALVSRWPRALPVFDQAHRARVGALSAALSGRRIWLAGSAFHGSGIDAAIRSAEAAAKALAP